MVAIILAFLLAAHPVNIEIDSSPRIADPLAPAREGKIYCEDPDHVAKTCFAFGDYAVADDGNIKAKVQAALNNEPPMSFTLESNMAMKNGQLCGMVTQQSLDSIQLLVGDEVFKSDEGDKVIEAIREDLANEFLGKEVCESHYGSGRKFMSFVYVDGVQEPDLVSEYEWINANDNYTLRTRNPLFD